MRTCLWVFLLVLAAISLDECFARHVPHPVAADELISTAGRLEEEEEAHPADYQWWTTQPHTPAADWEFLTRGDAWTPKKLRHPFRFGLWRGVPKADVANLPNYFLAGDGKTPLISIWNTLPLLVTCQRTSLGDGTGFVEDQIQQQGLSNAIHRSNAWVAGNPNSVASVVTGHYVSLTPIAQSIASTMDDAEFFEDQYTLISLDAARAKLREKMGIPEAEAEGEASDSDEDIPLFTPSKIKANTLGPTLNVHTLSASSVAYGSNKQLEKTRRNYVDMLMLWSPPADPNWWDVARDTGNLVPKYSFYEDVGAYQSDVAYIVKADWLPLKAFRVRVYKPASCPQRYHYRRQYY